MIFDTQKTSKSQLVSSGDCKKAYSYVTTSSKFWAPPVNGPGSATQLRDAKRKCFFPSPGSSEGSSDDAKQRFCILETKQPKNSSSSHFALLEDPNNLGLCNAKKI